MVFIFSSPYIMRYIYTSLFIELSQFLLVIHTGIFCKCFGQYSNL